MDGAEDTADQIVRNDQSVDARKRRRSKSKVWQEFTPVLNGQSAECRHCLKRLSGKSTGGTSHLSRHLKVCPARPGNTGEQPHCSPPHPLEDLSRTRVSNLCPFPIMGSAGFRQVLAGLYHPTSSMISQVATEEQFITMFQNEKLKLKEEIASAPGGIFLSLGRWELEMNVVMCMTVHFIDGEWKMHRKIVRCFFLETNDKSEYYISILPNFRILENFSYSPSNPSIVPKETVNEYSLQDKLLGITMDESVDAEIILSDLEKILTGSNYLLAKCKLITIPCLVNGLHQLFDSSPNDIILEASKKWFDYMTCSPLRKEKYRQVLSRVCLHRPTFSSKRWYSTFYLMEALLQFNKEFPNPEQMDSKSYPSKPPFETIEAAESFCQVARPIYHAIRVLSSPRAILNSCFHALWSVRTALQESSGKICMERVLDIKDMLDNFDKDWKTLYMWLSLAVVLDPRYKMRFLEDFFKQSYGYGARMYISEVRGKIYELFIRYSCRADQPSTNNDMQMNTHGINPLDGTGRNYNNQGSNEGYLRELHVYLDGELCDPNDVNYVSMEALSQDVHFDILRWWKDNAFIYPVLAALARDFLAIPGCAVSAESAFDKTDERAHIFYRKLSHEMVEAVICTQDWFQDSGMSDADGGICTMPI